MVDERTLGPRTRRLLVIAANLLFDEGRLDVEQDNPDRWILFDRYPRTTKGQDARWRDRALQSFEDLAADIDKLGTPVPRCTADEVALWLMLDLASGIEEEREAWPELWTMVTELPAHRHDFDWDSLRENLFEDTDFLMLYSPALDGLDDPADEVNQALGIGENLQPQHWFTLFGGAAPRTRAAGDLPP